MSGRLATINNWPELAAQAHWNVAELADLCGVSVKTLERHFLNTFGKPPHEWMHELRLEQVATGLQNGEAVKLAANKAGYGHPSHCSRDFKKHFGRSPSEFRRAPRL
jgi:AraC family transcriptional regulator